MSNQQEKARNLRLVTIGAYGFDEEAFFQALLQAQVDTFCDVRRRRGMRGARYAFANSKRLQARLEALGIRYVHLKALAPTEAVRRRQKAADEDAGVAKRNRKTLSPAFTQAYQDECLCSFDVSSFLTTVGPQARTVALFCVEREPAACHRSLAAERLAEALRLDVTHVLSPEQG